MRAARLTALAAVILGGCTTGQSNIAPPVTTTPSKPALEFAVGTVNYANTGIGLNVIETFRGTNGYTAVPINTAVLKGPTGFEGVPGSKDPGAGSATVPIGSNSNFFQVGPTSQTNLAAADGFGIGPPSSSTTGLNPYPFQPQFADVVQSAPFSQGAQPIYGGPPLYPPASFVQNALSAEAPEVPTGWAEGFYLLALGAPPPSGTYGFTISYSQNGPTSSTTASASLAASKVLPALEPPLISSTGNGGATVQIALPAGVTEALVNVIDVTTAGSSCEPGIPFATLKFTASGSATIPASLGAGAPPSFCKGDTLVAQIFGFDYAQYELGPPGNTSQNPGIPKQADMTISQPNVTQE